MPTIIPAINDYTISLCNTRYNKTEPDFVYGVHFDLFNIKSYKFEELLAKIGLSPSEAQSMIAGAVTQELQSNRFTRLITQEIQNAANRSRQTVNNLMKGIQNGTNLTELANDGLSDISNAISQTITSVQQSATTAASNISDRVIEKFANTVQGTLTNLHVAMAAADRIEIAESTICYAKACLIEVSGISKSKLIKNIAEELSIKVSKAIKNITQDIGAILNSTMEEITQGVQHDIVNILQRIQSNQTNNMEEILTQCQKQLQSIINTVQSKITRAMQSVSNYDYIEKLSQELDQDLGLTIFDLAVKSFSLATFSICSAKIVGLEVGAKNLCIAKAAGASVNVVSVTGVGASGVEISAASVTVVGASGVGLSVASICGLKVCGFRAQAAGIGTGAGFGVCPLNLCLKLGIPIVDGTSCEIM